MNRPIHYNRIETKQSDHLKDRLNNFAIKLSDNISFRLEVRRHHEYPNEYDSARKIQTLNIHLVLVML